MSGTTRVPSYAALLALTDGDPYVRWGVPDPLHGEALAVPGAVAVERHGRRHSLVVLPTPGSGDTESGVDRMLAVLATEGHVARLGVASLSVPQAYAGRLAAHFRVDGGGDWDWMWTTTQPGPVPGEERLVTLDDTADAAELCRLEREHSPRGEGEAGTGVSEAWLGIRDPHGRLVAAGAMQRFASGAPHLAGIVVTADQRGRGLGTAVTAGLTRLGLADSGVCTLGMYSDNQVARTLYHRLGYRTAYAWCSRRLVTSPVSGRPGR
jgi:ribosomal protein S18 acetylase RimI-like enzyme